MVGNLCALAVIRYQIKKNARALYVICEECQLCFGRAKRGGRPPPPRRPVRPGRLFIITASERGVGERATSRGGTTTHIHLM